MPLDALTRRCVCHALIQDPAAIACDSCKCALVPHHSTWPGLAKWFMVSDLARRQFHAWKSEQQSWEHLVRDTMCQGGTAPNPRGSQYTAATPLAELYPRVLDLAQAWKLAGSPIAQAVDLAPRATQKRTA